jgi:serralysin
MTKKTKIGNLTNENFTGESGSTWINEIYGDAKNLKGNAIGGNDTITGGNDGAKNHLYGDAHSLKENAKGGVDTITGGSNGSTNYIYGDAYSMECNAKGVVDTITGGAFGATNYIYGDAYRMKGNVQGGNDILVGGLNAKNFIYGDAFAMSNGAKAGDDAISLASSETIQTEIVERIIQDGSFNYTEQDFDTKIQNNTLIGDADNIVNSSSGADSINVGNNSVIDIKTQALQSVDGSIITASSNVDLDISKNSLIGDAKSLKNSSSGNDTVAVGSDIESKLDKITVISKSNSNSNLIPNSKASASSTVSINLSSNRLVGDAENIASSSAGHDSLSVGDNLKSTVAGVVNSSSNGNAVDSDVLLNFKFLDNVLFGDADRLKNSSAGDDAISVGNNIQNTIGKYDIRVTGNDSLINPSLPIISSNVSADFTFSGNELIGDAATIERSAAGKDALGIGNNLQSTLDSIESTSLSDLSFNASETISYKASNNRLIGDAKNMIHSSSGADTIGMGNNLKNSIGDISVSSTGLGTDKISVAASYFISENSLIGDSLSIKNSSAGDDILEVGNNFSNVFKKISSNVNSGKMSVISLDSNFTVSNNSLIGDAENMRDSSSGYDVISLGNAFNADIAAIDNYALALNSLADTTVSLKYAVSDNRLIGDAKTMQDSSGVDDRLAVGNDITISVSSINNIVYSKGSIQSDVLFNFSLVDNILLGDAESMMKSSGGHDTIELGNNFKNNLSKIISQTNFESSVQSLSTLEFSLSENALHGDAKTMSHASGGDDQIIVGNSIRNQFGDIEKYFSNDSSISVILESNFSLLNNFLVGDAKSMSHSQGGNDVISLGDNFVNSIGTITSTLDIFYIDKSSISVIFEIQNNNLYGDAQTMSYSKGGSDTLSIGMGIVGDSQLILDIKNNTLYGDAETMSYSKGGNDTLSIGVGIEFAYRLDLDIKDNTLYGDANTMQRSQGGDDKLTGADGEGSVTYLYGDAKFTDGKSGAGNDTLISGHGNDHMWGDFGGNINQNVPYVNYSTGKDIFVFGENNGNDIIYDFQRGLDKIDLRSLVGIDNINDLTITSSLTQPSDKVINLNDGNSITLIGVNELSANDFMFAAVV